MSDEEGRINESFKNEDIGIDHLVADSAVPSSSSSISSSSTADKLGCNFIERITPKVLFVGSSLKIGSSHLLSKEMPNFMRQELGVAFPSSMKNYINLEHPGLDKYRKYVESNRTYADIIVGDGPSSRTIEQGEMSCSVGNRTYADIIVGDGPSSRTIEQGEMSCSVGKDVFKKESEGLTLRPPVLGHTSSSSNDSGSIMSGSSGNECEDVPASTIGIIKEIVSSNVSLAAQSSREDYISEKPPEGSSDLSSLGIQQEQPPSSASSVASLSVRPLEWDSGADVGYYQIYSSTNHDEKKISTIERMAIATGSAAMLIRSDPEGTTEYCSQLASTIPSNKSLRKVDIRDRLGHPVAESTPFSIDDIRPENLLDNEDNLSPIMGAESSEHLTSININTNPFQKQVVCQMKPLEKEKRSRFLFPEIMSTYTPPSSGENDAQVQPSLENKLTSSSGSSYFKPNVEEAKKTENDKTVVCKVQEYSVNEFNKADISKTNFRKSCSMEHLGDNELLKHPQRNHVFNTLPRSQSHSKLDVCEKIPESNSLPKYIFLTHNPTKSASSSSISTVVQRRKDSPKHISKLVQTSILNQSIGVQTNATTRCSTKCSNSQKSQLFKSGSNSSRELLNSSHLPNSKFSVTKNDQVYHVHNNDGSLCSGAYKKVYDRKQASKHGLFQSNDVRESKGEMASDPSPSNKQDRITENVDYKESNNDINDGNGTLDSVNSSVKTEQQIWEDRHESIGVEDRANSFEYLPGHMYENAARPNDPSEETSSISLNRDSSPQNEISDEADKSWDRSNSSTFVRDMERGVEMMIEFVQHSKVDGSELKKKLMKRVAEKLIATEMSVGSDELDDKNPSSMESHSLSNGRPRVLRSGRETRRSLLKEIPHHESPLNTDRTSSRASSDNLRKKASCSSANKVLREDKCVGTECNKSSKLETKEPKILVGSTGIQSETTSSNELLNSKKTYIGKIYKSNDKQRARNFENQENESKKMPTSHRFFKTPETSSTFDSNVSSSVYNSTDSRPPPALQSEIVEQKRKCKVGNVKKSTTDNGSSKALIDLLSVERENQRLMIQTEIEHLDYLRRLLRKQEELRDSLARIQKSRKMSSELANKRSQSAHGDKNHERVRTGLVSHLNPRHQSNLKISEHSKGWDSHHYSSSIDEIESISLEENNGNNLSTRRQQNRNEPDSAIEIKSRAKYEATSSVRRRSSKDEERHTATQSHGKKCSPAEIEAPSVPSADTLLENAHSGIPSTCSSSKQSPAGKNKCNCKKKGVCKCSQKDQTLQRNKKALAYFITFEEKQSESNSNIGTDSSLEEVKMMIPNKSDSPSRIDIKKQDKSRILEKENREPKVSRKIKECKPSLQEYLLMNRAEYVNRAEYRRKCVAELAYLRELRNKSKRHLLVMAPESSDYSQSTTPRDLPPPPLAVKRVFNQRTMRRQTERKYRQLAEVQNRQIDLKRKESYRTNRLMAEIFTKKLKKRVLNGETNLSNSVSVISSL